MVCAASCAIAFIFIVANIYCCVFSHRSGGVIQEFVAKEGLRYYNEDIHANTFALPNFVKELVRKK